MRPRLHRYCARMVGSVIDGEDVLQDALIKAVEAQAGAGAIGNPEGWLFRIAHNTALDFLRRRNRQEALRSDEEVDMIADQLDAVESRQIAATSLRTFMRLPVAQRASVILTDVLGCSLAGSLRDHGLQPARGQGRAASRPRAVARNCRRAGGHAATSDCRRPIARGSAPMSPHFNARDFDAIRAMIADDVRLELVNKSRMRRQGRSSRYFGNYATSATGVWCPGLVEGVPPSWCSIRTNGIRGRNISCCWAGRPTRSRPSAISATRLTSSMARNIWSEQQRP